MTPFRNIAPLIIAQTDDWVAINKPSGLLTIPDRNQKEKSLKEFLQEKFSSIFTVHRIDKETSGLLLFARHHKSHQYLSDLFLNRDIEKIYLGIVSKIPEKNQGYVEAPIAENPARPGAMIVHRNGKQARTAYKVLEAHPSFSLVEFNLLTGRTHQIRVHAKELGNPLACDALYGSSNPIYLSAIKPKYKSGKHSEEERPILSRLALHSWKLSFIDQNGQKINLEAPVPKEFKALMNQLGKL